MKLVGVISCFTGWFGALLIADAIGGGLGVVIGVVLLFVVGMAHNWVALGSDPYEPILRKLGKLRD